MSDCKTNYKKDCHIKTVPKPVQLRVKICKTAYSRDCGVQVDESKRICSTEYEKGK